MLKALVIQGVFPELGDVLKISRAEGQKAFHTRENVYVTYFYRSLGSGSISQSYQMTRSTKFLEKE